ncbi:MAG: hypothetical protein WKG01_05805 [Kofleriaceae bacterium]
MTTQSKPLPASDSAEEQSLETQVVAQLETLGQAIQQRPLIAVGIAFGIGFVLARLLGD